MIDFKNSPNFNVKNVKNKPDEIVVKGNLECCCSQFFTINVYGSIQKSLFGKKCLMAKNERIIITAKCIHCGKTFLVFDNCCNGYDNCQSARLLEPNMDTFLCEKCLSNNFSLEIKYEYPSEEELDSLGFLEKEEAFTWIWITIKCNNCGCVYKNFVDFETG